MLEALNMKRGSIEGAESVLKMTEEEKGKGDGHSSPEVLELMMMCIDPSPPSRSDIWCQYLPQSSQQ